MKNFFVSFYDCLADGVSFLADGFAYIGEGMASITLFPPPRPRQFNIRPSTSEDAWKAVGEDMWRAMAAVHKTLTPEQQEQVYNAISKESQQKLDFYLSEK